MLIGEQIYLTLATPDDAPLIAAWFSDPEYLGPFNNTWPMSRQEWEQNLGGHGGGHDSGFYLMRRRESGEPLGAIGYFVPFTQADFFKGYEIWYQVHPSQRRQGVARQAACLLINHLFGATPIPRIQATIAVGNAASCRVVEAAGMARDGLYRGVTFLRGTWTDMYLYAITRADWADEATYRQGCVPF
jgi:RimJ/RimL family protein N-acetyltransferase